MIAGTSVESEETFGHLWRAELIQEILFLRGALNKPLRETILAVLTMMPKDAAPEHLAAMIERQVQAWQAIPVRDGDS